MKTVKKLQMDYAKLDSNLKAIMALRENLVWALGIHCLCHMDACITTKGMMTFSGIRLYQFKRACPVGPFWRDIDIIAFVKNKAKLISRRLFMLMTITYDVK